MTLLNHELRRGKLSTLIWAVALAFMLAICILIYPEMASQMNEISSMFADMGSFTAAFGMDQLNFGEFKGYFGIECGNSLGIGGAIFAALLGISAIAKEEKEHTAEFLLTHPISREKVYLEKFLAVIIQVIILNVIIAVVTFLSTLIIGETLPWGQAAILFLAYTFLQIQIAGITFGLSAFIKGSGLGIGIGLGLSFYFINIVSNLIEKGKFLKYITPFAYADSATIFKDGYPNMGYVLFGLLMTITTLIAGLIKYKKKDIT